MNTNQEKTKPLGGKAYGSIGHLPGSRVGPGDHTINPGQAAICLEKARKGDLVIVTEKLDGSNVAVLRQGDAIVPLIRAGWPANTSPYEQHQLFWRWALENQWRFLATLQDGERLCGEWLAQAHGTRYDLRGRDPFVAFDLIANGERLPYAAFQDRIAPGFFFMPAALHWGPAAYPIESALAELGERGHYAALDLAEGAVWRVETRGKFNFIGKYVRPGKVDGSYLVETVDGVQRQLPATWNWRPSPSALDEDGKEVRHDRSHRQRYPGPHQRPGLQL